MALTARQIRILNDLDKYIPALKRGQLTHTDQIRLGDFLSGIALIAVVSADGVAAVTADADATYGTPERDLINELKANFNALVTLVNEIKVSVNASVT